ncbi:SseB family protein [Frankia sp. Ag45/Mut15]|uniref:SseB family protein n=1 Tax=Frankia umida TaxID=573489 RepID=A0ABT0K2Q8_9ACTN|nr:SseB family protein [Frankia umida]MCK9877809.1 SseB family protein [Frankia umida]
MTDDQLRPAHDAFTGPDATAEPDGRTGADTLTGADSMGGPDGPQAERGTAARAALCRLADGENERSALGDLALADVLLPDLGDDVTDLSDADGDVLQLPVAQRQDGTQFVPTFTSEQRLAAALPEVDRYRTVQIATLGRIWPSDELLLAVDPGSEAGIALPAEGLRALAAMSS